jgi:hypothetical protein
LKGEPISSSLRAFIADHIRSVVELESLLLLHNDTKRDWSAAELARELRIDEQWAMRQFIYLAEHGLIAVNEASVRYRYAPKSPSLDELVKQLSLDYEQRRVSVIELIYAKPADPLQSFADAFRFRKERPNG